ncbi:UNVERIFIED_CONTAM: hypothetical protein BEN50_26190 [Euhalothece sp. KZN 001]
MAENKQTLNIDLKGEVTAGDFRTVVDSFVELVDALALSQDPESNLEWAIDDLKAGSAFISIRPLGDTAERKRLAVAVLDEYDRVAEAISVGNVDDYGYNVVEPITRITSVLNGRIPQICMSTSNREPYDIVAKIGPPEHVQAKQDHPIRFKDYVRTALRGKIVNLSDKKGLCFTLEEQRTQRQVRCYPTHDRRQAIGNYWADKRWIIVEGTFKRHSSKGTMSQITDIVPIDPLEGTWRDAIGIAPRPQDRADMTSEGAVRKLRDE